MEGMLEIATDEILFGPAEQQRRKKWRNNDVFSVQRRWLGMEERHGALFFSRRDLYSHQFNYAGLAWPRLSRVKTQPIEVGNGSDKHKTRPCGLLKHLAPCLANWIIKQWKRLFFHIVIIIVRKYRHCSRFRNGPWWTEQCLLRAQYENMFFWVFRKG